MIRDFFVLLAVGIGLLILQTTWLYGDWINPFRLDLVFIFIVFLATQNRPGLGLILSALMGFLVDILSWGILGLSMTLYPLIFWLFYFVWVRTNIQSLIFKVISVLLLQILYSFAVYLFLLHSSNQDFSPYQTFYTLVQSLITTLASLPLLYLFQIFLSKRPALR